MSARLEVDRTILFADVSGSTALYQRMGDQPARALIAKMLECLQRVIESFTGEVVKFIGDELMCVFPGAECALEAAISMQRCAAGSAEPSPLSLRIGFHHGQMLVERGDYFGDAVNVAARVAAAATAERILTTEAVCNTLPPHVRNDLQARGVRAFKGIAKPMHLFEVQWREGTRSAPNEFAPDTFEFGYESCRLTHAGQEFVMTRKSPPFTIGRSDQNALRLDDDCVSGRHATISFWGGRFYLLDSSTNGVHVRFDHGQAGTGTSAGRTFKVPKELKLRGSGTLWVGRYPRDPVARVVEFVCE